MFISDEGIGLGIEIAQREASIIPNVLNHYLGNNSLFIERYMDDTVCLMSNYSDALNLLNNYKRMCSEYGIIINDNKMKIINCSDFVYCKWKYIIGSKIKIVPINKTLYRQRRILRRMIRKNIDYRLSLNSYCAYLNTGNSYKYIRYLNKIVNL